MHSDALDLEPHIFESDDPKRIARSLKKSAQKSDRREAEPFRSAMSMLTFYANRRTNLSAERKEALDQAKEESRKLFNRGQP